MMTISVRDTDGSGSKLFDPDQVGDLWFGFGKFPLKAPKNFNFCPLVREVQQVNKAKKILELFKVGKKASANCH